MVSAAESRASSFGGLKKFFLIVVALFASFFIVTQVIAYFDWNEETYGYYWQFRKSLLTHVIGGFIALTVGVFQLWSGLSGNAMSKHPLTGWVYAVGVAVGSAGAFALSINSAAYGLAWGVGLFTLGVAWLGTTGTAIYCIRNRRVVLHKQWMTRSYIVTFAFVTFRIVTDHVPYEALWGISRPDMSVAMIWPSWVVPLLAYEMYLAFKQS